MMALLDDVIPFRELLYQVLVAETKRVAATNRDESVGYGRLAAIATSRVLSAAGCGGREIGRAAAAEYASEPNERAEP